MDEWKMVCNKIRCRCTWVYPCVSLFKYIVALIACVYMGCVDHLKLGVFFRKALKKQENNDFILNVMMDSSLKSMGKNSFGGWSGFSSIYNVVINFSVGRLLGRHCPLASFASFFVESVPLGDT